MKTDRKALLTVSAALLGSTLVLAGCSREIGASTAGDEAVRSAAEASGAARTAVDDLASNNQALMMRVQELESRLERSEGRPIQHAAAPGYPAQSYQSNRSQPEPSHYSSAPASTYSRNVSAQYAGSVPETTSADYRYDDQRYQTTPALADADWTTPSRFRDVPRPSAPPTEQQRPEQQRYEPTWRRVTVEEGTPISVKILESLSTKYTRTGEPFHARLASDLLAENGSVAVPAGAEISGHVSGVKKNQRIGGKASLTLAMDRIELPDGSSAPLAAAWSTTGKSQTAKDAATIGGATVGGAILGRILDHGNGDVLGGLLGAAAGTALAHEKIGAPIGLGSGAVIQMHLRAPIDVRVRS